MIVFYYQTKTPIDFWYRWGLNPKFFIQSLETLLIELTETHSFRPTTLNKMKLLNFFKI